MAVLDQGWLSRQRYMLISLKKKKKSLISKTQMMEKERTDSHKLSSDLQKHAVSQCTHASTQKDK